MPTPSHNDYLNTPTLDQVVGAFDRLANDLWSENLERTYWISGNTLHSAVNFILAGVEAEAGWLEGQGSRLPVIQKMIADAYAYHQKTFNDSGLWYDDQTYWGIVLLKVHENFSTLSGGADTITNGTVTVNADDCLNACLQSWSFVQKAWDARVLHAQDAPVKGGCWNYCNKYGVQNTVTNCMYLLLSIRLFQALGKLDGSSSPPRSVITDLVRQEALRFTCKIFYWLRSWIFLDKTGPHQDSRVVLVNNMNNDEVKDGSGKALWLTRDTAYPQPSASTQAVAALEQGAIMEAMVTMLAHQADVTVCFDSPELQSYIGSASYGKAFEADAKEILANLDRGCREALFHNQGSIQEPQFVLQDWPFQLLYDDSYGLDESTSKGLFMRYWARVIPEMSTYVKGQIPASYLQDAQALVKQTAAAVWATRSSQAGSLHQLSPNWADSQGREAFIAQFQKTWAIDPGTYKSSNTEYSSANQIYSNSASKQANAQMANFVSQSIGLDALTAYMSQL